MPDKQTEKPMTAIPEKWFMTRPFLDKPEIEDINPAWADYMEAFAKEMAGTIAGQWRHANTNYCDYCGVYTKFITYGEWECDHKPTCPVPRAQEYLKEP